MSQTQDSLAASNEIIARPDRRYRGKHYLFAIIMIIAGFWFAYDGWIGWPHHNQHLAALQQGIDRADQTGDTNKLQDLKDQLASMHAPYSDMDLLIQRLLAMGLPILGIFYGAWTIATTRGQYRLVGQTLMLPGLDPIDFAEIRGIDKSRWDRKGIAIIHYQLRDPVRARSVKLDDFAFEREPTDAILKRIETYLSPESQVPAESLSQ